MIEQSESIVKLAAAMVAASGELKNPPKDSVNPHFKSRFADLATVIDTVKPTLTRHKLAVIQLPTESNGLPALATMLMHESGEWIRTTVLLCAVKTDPQGIGSAITYARRYGLQAALNITADDDDDGHQGSQPAKPQQQKPVQQQPTQQPATGYARPTNEELKQTMQAKNWTWAAVVTDINANDGEKYPLNVKPDDIKANQLRAFFEWLKDQPAKPKPQGA